MNDRTTITSEFENDIDTDIAIEPERYEFFEGPAYRFDLDRRGFLKAMGGGILILSLLDRDADVAEAQQPGGRQRGAAAGEASRRPRTSAPGCTSARTAGSPSIRARPKWGRTSERR